MIPLNRRTALFTCCLTLLGLSQSGSASETVSVDVVVRSGSRVSGPEVLRLKRGDTVRLTVLSDAADELHVHGYDLHAALVPDKPATLTFVATRTGRFSAELHKAGTALVTLEIYPR
jgi:plastocyanin